MNIHRRSLIKSFEDRLRESMFIGNPYNFNQGEILLNTDLSSNAGWVSSGSGQSYDATNDEWDFSSPNTSGAMYAYYDLGEVISGDFYMEFKIRMDALDASDGCGVGIHWAGLSDLSTTMGVNVAQDSIGFAWWTNDVDLSITDGTGTAQPTGDNTLTTGTWYVRVYNNGGTISLDLDNNSDFSSPAFSDSGSKVGSGHRYVHLYSHHTNSGACGAGSNTGALDDIYFAKNTSVKI